MLKQEQIERELRGEKPELDKVTLRFPPNLIKALDSIVKNENYSTRAELIREAMRDRLIKSGAL